MFNLAFCLLIVAMPYVYSQGTYSFSYSAHTYEPLKDPIVLNDSTFPEFWDEFMIEVDFPIHYFGKKLYSVLVKNRGDVIMGNVEERIELFPVQLKLKQDSKISYTVDGELLCSNRILKIEFQNMGFRCDTTDTYFANAQLWIYEKTGVIEIHYGESFDNPEVYRVNENNCYGQFYYGSRLRFHVNLSAMPYNAPDQPDFFLGDLSDVDHWGIGAIPSAGMVYRFDPLLVTGNNFTISPNPSRYSIKLSRPQECGDFDIRIFDSNGRLLIRQEFASSFQYIDITHLNPGVYFVHLWDREEGKGFVDKLMKL